jgi:transposase-like protein
MINHRSRKLPSSSRQETLCLNASTLSISVQCPKSNPANKRFKGNFHLIHRYHCDYCNRYNHLFHNRDIFSHLHFLSHPHTRAQ